MCIRAFMKIKVKFINSFCALHIHCSFLLLTITIICSIIHSVLYKKIMYFELLQIRLTNLFFVDQPFFYGFHVLLIFIFRFLIKMTSRHDFWKRHYICNVKLWLNFYDIYYLKNLLLLCLWNEWRSFLYIILLPILFSRYL